MKPFLFAHGLLVAILLHFQASTALSTLDVGTIVPGSYLVEFEDGQDKDSFLGSLDAAGIEYIERLEMNSKLFKGISFRVLNATGPTEASKAPPPQARNIWPIQPGGIPEFKRSSVASGIKDSRRNIGREDGNNYRPHVMTQIDQLHALGYTGKGIKIGIVDSGVDYTHPALGGCFGEGCVISFGRDITGDDWDGEGIPEGDDDPLDTVNGHGTFVAGVIAAQPNEHDFVGAAHKATVGMYKITFPASTDLIAGAILEAFEDGSDIISLSLGSLAGSSQAPLAVVASRIVAAGTTVVAAAGNYGTLGGGLISSPATGSGVISVGSVWVDEMPQFGIEASWSLEDGVQNRFTWVAGGHPFQENVTLPLWAADMDFENGNQACSSLPDDVPDLAGRIVLARTDSDCRPFDQYDNLVAKGAEYILFYSTKNVTAFRALFDEWQQGASVGVVAPHYAALWFEALKESRNITVSITELESADEVLEYLDTDEYAGTMSDFSTWGPTWELNMEPTVSAPGQGILGLLPLDMGGYSVEDGTSNSAPLISGLVALIMEATGEKDPAVLKSMLASRADPRTWFNAETGDGAEHEYLAPVFQQGTGLVRGVDSLFTTTTTDRSYLSFNDTDNFEAKQTFAIRNGAKEKRTYYLSHVPAATAEFMDEATNLPNFMPESVLQVYAEMKFKSKKVVVPAGGSAEVSLTGKPPKGLDPDLLPFYGGYIKIEASGHDETLLLPYVGVAASLIDTPTLLPGIEGGNSLTAYNSWPYEPVEANTTFRIPKGPLEWDGPYPAWDLRSRTASAIFRGDLIALDNVDLPTYEHLGYVCVHRFMFQEWFYAGAIRNAWPVTGEMADGTFLPEGRYQMIGSALRVNGDPNREEHWDVVEMVPFGLEYRD